MKQIGGCLVKIIVAAIFILAVPMMLFPLEKQPAAPVTLEAVAKAGAIIPIMFIGFLAVAYVVILLGSDPGKHRKQPPAAAGKQPVLGGRHFTRRPEPEPERQTGRGYRETDMLWAIAGEIGNTGGASGGEIQVDLNVSDSEAVRHFARHGYDVEVAHGRKWGRGKTTSIVVKGKK